MSNFTNKINNINDTETYPTLCGLFHCLLVFSIVWISVFQKVSNRLGRTLKAAFFHSFPAVWDFYYFAQANDGLIYSG